MSLNYLTAEELSGRITYDDARANREQNKDSVLLEASHHIRPLGGRKIFFIRDRIEHDMAGASNDFHALPMTSGIDCHA